MQDLQSARGVSVVTLLQRLKAARGDARLIARVISEAEAELSGQDDAAALSEVYGVAVDVYPNEGAGFGELCAKHMRALCKLNPAEARDFHNRQRAFGMGKIDARVYEARATMEARLGDTAKAVKMLQEGLRVSAQPADVLRRRLEQLESQSAEAEAEATEGGEEDTEVPEPATAPSAKAPKATLEVRSPPRKCPDLDAAPAAPSSPSLPVLELLSAPSAPRSTRALSSRRSSLDEDPVRASLRRRLERSRSAVEALLLERRRRSLLATALGPWRRASELTQQCRREAIFDAMSAQVQSHRRDGSAAERCSAGMLRAASEWQAATLATFAFAAWRAQTLLAQRRSAQLRAVARAEVRRRLALDAALAARVLAAWLREASHGLAQCLRREESASESLLDDLLVDMGGDCAGEQGAARAPERRAPGAPGGIGLLSPREVERRPLADLGEESDRSPTGVLVEAASAAMANQAAAGLSHGSRKVKGPERFYYDTSTYTGAHRFPGPSVDGKENFGNSRQRRDSGARKPQVTSPPVASGTGQTGRPALQRKASGGLR